jgi:hypothetical protein
VKAQASPPRRVAVPATAMSESPRRFERTVKRVAIERLRPDCRTLQRPRRSHSEIVRLKGSLHDCRPSAPGRQAAVRKRSDFVPLLIRVNWRSFAVQECSGPIFLSNSRVFLRLELVRRIRKCENPGGAG